MEAPSGCINGMSNPGPVLWGCEATAGDDVPNKSCVGAPKGSAAGALEKGSPGVAMGEAVLDCGDAKTLSENALVGWGGGLLV